MVVALAGRLNVCRRAQVAALDNLVGRVPLAFFLKGHSASRGPRGTHGRFRSCNFSEACQLPASGLRLVDSSTSAERS